MSSIALRQGFSLKVELTNLANVAIQLAQKVHLYPASAGIAGRPHLLGLFVGAEDLNCGSSHLNGKHFIH